MKLQLHRKVFLTLVLVGVIPLLALAFLTLYSLNVFHRADVKSIEQNLINQKSEEVKAFLEEILGALQIRVGYDNVGHIAPEEQRFLLTKLLEEFAEIEEASLVNVLPTPMGEQLQSLRAQNLEPERFVQDRESMRYLRSPGKPSLLLEAELDELQDQSRIEKFEIARQGLDYIGPIYFTLQGPMVTVATAVRNRAGNTVEDIISMISAEVNLSKIQKIMQRSQLGKTGYLYVVSKDGFLIAHSLLLGRSLGNLRSIPFVDSTLGESKDIPDRYVSATGEEVATAGRYLPNLKMAIIAEWPAADADKVLVTVRNQVLLISTGVLLLIVIASLVLTNRIVKPIKTLEVGTQLVAQGKFDKPVSIKTGDELEQLGRAFNEMMKGLKRLEELKEEFVFVAAHELRTPVTAIKGYLSMILEGEAGPVSSEVKDLIKEVITANQRLIQLVNDLLQVARSEAGRLTIEVAALDIGEPSGEVLKELKPLADEKKIKLVYEPPATLPKVLADRTRLKEVMVNLVGNAIKYTLGEGRVTVRHKIQDRTLVTDVQDTGIGISEEAQKKLFEKFYRVQNEKTRDITGTGLGLFIVKQLVEKMNGKIWVESAEGQGSTFSFSLPLAEAR